MKKIICVVSVILFFVSCNKKVEEINTGQKYLKDFNNSKKMEELSNKVLNEGDTIAFLEMSDIYALSSHQKEFLWYALRMATDYEYHGAYYEAYFILHTDYDIEKHEGVNKLANYYLLKAYELGNKDCKASIKERFNQSEIPTSKEYWRTFN
ncbi:hypothetical protein [Flavobacterium cerinum]|uniref:Sel1 repeat family protein n=1 Tax=Flavobacterium cerinum TaxID=2502784 RepID=A0A3S3TYE1_9FLAO|nr:hypothetical protein [Flavobacterium cerinum]RWW96705.1 hypothetical protein EPI11_14015 [Flavobacterium cerinum]